MQTPPKSIEKSNYKNENVNSEKETTIDKENNDESQLQNKTEFGLSSGTMGRDFVTSLVASNIEDIIEEEEEEDDVDIDTIEGIKNNKKKESENNDNNIEKIEENRDRDDYPSLEENKIEESEPDLRPRLETQLSEIAEEELEPPDEEITETVVYGENTKFTLEPVDLDEEAKNEEKNDEDEKDENGENAEKEEELGDSNEIRVEEGYATRQMDEFFRQTIAQIKEELTKKLENNDENDDDEDIGDFSDEDEDEDFSDYDDDYDEDDIENQRFNIETTELNRGRAHYNQSYRINRNVLYQKLLAPASKTSKTKTENSISNRLSCWLVLLGSIINMIILEGLCFNYLNIFSFMREEFQLESRLISTLPTTFLLGFYILIAPIALFLTKLYGTKNVSRIGSIISTFSLIICSFQDNIFGFCLTYGVFTGIGIGFIYVPSMISISKWFLKERLLASTLATLGTCIGAAFYPILSNYLIEKYEFYGSLLILSGVQLNCLVGSMLLKETNVPFSLLENTPVKKNNDIKSMSNSLDPLKPKKKEGFKAKTASLTFLVENEVNNNNVPDINNNENSENGIDIEKKIQNKHTREYNFRKMNNQKRKSALRRNLILADANSETQSTVSTSTASYNNYTLKQYWRRFIQTRQNNSNPKKNLFHLIAEEKKKTRTLSKTSLEDGFVITTSNNLLAPNDEENVIIFARKAEILENIKNSKNTENNEEKKSATSRFFSRIANSIRSLGQSSQMNQPSSSTLKIPGGDNNIENNNTLNTPKISHYNLQSQSQSQKLGRPTVHYNEKSENEQNSKNNDEVLKLSDNDQNEQKEQQLPLQLISVFEGPITDETPDASKTDENAMPPTLSNVFSPMNNLENDLHTNLISPNEINYSENNSDEEDENKNNKNNDQKSPNIRKKMHKKLEVNMVNDDFDDEDTAQNYVKNYNKTSGSTPNSILKTSRYFSYRSSLTNSVRGSLMEYTVPEDGVHNEFDTNNLDSASINFTKPRNQGHYSNQNRFNRNSSRSNQKINQNNTLKSSKSTNNEGLFSLKFNSLLMNTRRFVSTIDAAGFLNYPINLESVEHNLRNSMIKKNADYYRRNNKSFYGKSGDEYKSIRTLFFQYLAYLFNFEVFFNPLLFFLNLSFFFNIIGVYVSIVYFGEFSQNQGVTHQQSLYILFLIILMQGFGRIFSTLLFKCNESSAKGRIFTYNFTLICLGFSILCATVLCDTVFSLTMFAMIFGSLYGFNSNLRSSFIYDVLGLNWSDDCLFGYASIAQALGIFIGLPLSGLIYDLTKSYLCVYYLSGVCFIISGIILIPGKKLTVQYSNSYKALNRFYFQRK